MVLPYCNWETAVDLLNSILCITCQVSWFVRNKLTVFMSGLAVTICFSAERNLFCLNSMSPAEHWNILNGDHSNHVHCTPFPKIQNKHIWKLHKEISIQKKQIPIYGMLNLPIWNKFTCIATSTCFVKKQNKAYKLKS